MGIENPVHLLFIGIVALIVLGPKRLPALARALGQGIREFRSALEHGASGDGEREAPPAGTATAAAAPPAGTATVPAAQPAGAATAPAAPDRLHSSDQGAATDER